MQKAVSATPAQKRLSDNSRSSSVPELRTESKLYNYITQQQLSDSLELLEALGYFGDIAIFTLAHFQLWGGEL